MKAVFIYICGQKRREREIEGQKKEKRKFGYYVYALQMLPFGVAYIYTFTTSKFI